MNLLFITTSLPYPPNTGGAIRAHGIIEGLRLAGHTIHLICFHDEIPPSDLGITIHPVPSFQRKKLDRLKTLAFTRQADIAGRFYSDAFTQKLTDLLKNQPFDLIQFEGIEAVCYLPLAKKIQPHAKLVFDTFNAEYMLQRNIFDIDRQSLKRLPMAMYSYAQIGRIKRYERDMCGLADAVIAVSEEDAVLLRPLCDADKVHVVPSGIWVKPYLQAPPPIDMHQPSIVFTGKMDYRPNIDAMLWFADDILPLIRAKMPNVHLYIVGQQPHPRLDRLKADDQIIITGKVESVIPYLYGGTAYIAPLRMGSGTRLKLLEAMACGCAITATTLAASGLRGAKSAMIIADDAPIFAKAVLNVLENPSKREEMGYSAQGYARRKYDWSAILPNLLKVYGALGLKG
ncbi:MAG: glycosyltransferase [Anaerolineae bacterium]|nr:glycosyltransferase [Anaerolineae bacterium]